MASLSWVGGDAAESAWLEPPGTRSAPATIPNIVPSEIHSDTQGLEFLGLFYECESSG